jgi:hypothetical protein
MSRVQDQGESEINYQRASVHERLRTVHDEHLVRAFLAKHVRALGTLCDIFADVAATARTKDK